MNKNMLIIIGVMGVIALIMIYFLTYDKPIQYGEGNLDPTAEDVIMFDEEAEDEAEDEATNYNAWCGNFV